MKPLNAGGGWKLCICKQCRGFPRCFARSGKRRFQRLTRREINEEKNER